MWPELAKLIDRIKDPAMRESCRLAAEQADEAAAAMDRAKSADAYLSSALDYRAAREKLLAAILRLSVSDLWSERGLGLLSVADAIRQTEPALFDLYQAIREVLAGAPQAARAELE